MKSSKNQEELPERMTEDEMNHVLLEFLSTNYFRAVMQYLNNQLLSVDETLKALDPFRQPTDIARSQGYHQAVQGFKSYLAYLAKKSSEVEDSGPQL